MQQSSQQETQEKGKKVNERLPNREHIVCRNCLRPMTPARGSWILWAKVRYLGTLSLASPTWDAASAWSLVMMPDRFRNAATLDEGSDALPTDPWNDQSHAGNRYPMSRRRMQTMQTELIIVPRFFANFVAVV